MAENRNQHLSIVDLESLQQNAYPMQPQIFRHQNLLKTLKTAAMIGRKKLVNTLDHIHFTNGTIFVHVSDPKYGEEYLLQACLGACKPEEIVCLWNDASVLLLPDNVKVMHMIVSDDLSLILIPLNEAKLNGAGFTAALPEKGYLLGKRRIRRYPCMGIHVNLTQSGFQAQGELIDFSPLGFRVHLKPDAKGSFVWLNEDSQCMIHLQKEQRTLFSGLCRYVRQEGDLFERTLALAPIEPAIRRFQKRKMRTPRLQIKPPLSAHFEHPFFGKPVQLDIDDLTFTGFAVEEQNDDSILLPGMIILGLEIRYAEVLKMICDVQVIYRREAGNGRIRNGLAILDMNFRAYRQLSHILVHADNPQAHFSCDLEMDNLWEFLFDTNFIYSRKYQILQSCREEFKETYRKLYKEDQDIEAHFTYQKNGRIYGHVSIFRAYQRTWMVHHLAARPLNGKRTGLYVLKNVLRFFDGLYRYPSIGMDYMLFYFRPENQFPNLFFGGFARDLKNPRACSLDLFAYLNYPVRSMQTPLPKGWQLADFTALHLSQLDRFYRNKSGGLMLDALPFGSRKAYEEPLEALYQRKGFLRQWSIHSLIDSESLKAVFIVNHSSVGLNLSELLNGIKIIVIDSTGLTWEAMTAALSRLTLGYTTENIPLLIYPSIYPGEQGIKVDKQYLLWILDSQYGKEYLEYMEKKTTITMLSVLKHLLKKIVSK